MLAVSLHPATSPTAATQGSSASVVSWDWVQPGVLSVLVLPAAAGHYTVLVELVGGLVMASASTVELALSVDSVSPSLGSFGGGTIITISGACSYQYGEGLYALLAPLLISLARPVAPSNSKRVSIHAAAQAWASQLTMPGC